MKNIILIVSFTILLLFLSSCGSSGGGDSTPIGGESTLKTAYLIDSAVSGVEYSSDKGDSGITGQDGSFQYTLNATIEFRLANVYLGQITTINSDTIVTLPDLAGVDRDMTSDEDVLKLARIFQSLDEDSDSSNGISISQQTIQTIENNLGSEVISISEITMSELEAEFTNITGKSLISTTEAQAHLKQEIQDIVGTDDTNDTNETTLCTAENSSPYDDIQVDGYCEAACNALALGNSSEITLQCALLENWVQGTIMDYNLCGACGEDTPIVELVDSTSNYYMNFNFSGNNYDYNLTNPYIQRVHDANGKTYFNISGTTSNNPQSNNTDALISFNFDFDDNTSNQVQNINSDNLDLSLVIISNGYEEHFEDITAHHICVDCFPPYTFTIEKKSDGYEIVFVVEVFESADLNDRIADEIRGEIFIPFLDVSYDY